MSRHRRYDRRMSGRVLVVALVMALAGCAATPPAEPDPSAVVTESPSASATPAPSQEVSVDAADPANWTIGFTGVGPIALGDDIEDVRARLSGFEESGLDAECPSVAFFRQGELELGLVLDPTERRLVEAVVVEGEGPTSVAGIGIGSDFAAARAAYPQASEFVGIGDSLNLSVSDDDGHWIHFSAGANDEIIGFIAVNRYPGSGYDYCD